MKKILTCIIGLTSVPLFSLTVSAADPINFEKQIWPIIEANCLECHKAPYEKNGRLRKPKGDLRVDSPKNIMKGSEHGAVVIPGKPTKSTFYTLTVLPEDDDDIMPAKGDPLTKAQTKLINQWILEGAKFGDWKGVAEDEKGKTEEKPTGESQAAAPHPMIPEHLKQVAEGVNPAKATDLADISEIGATVYPIAQNFPLLRVEFVSREGEIDDSVVAKLMPLRNHITELNLARTKISDSALRTISSFHKLTRLYLNGTDVTDAGLSELRSLRHLEYINIYNTKVSNRGVRYLQEIPTLREVYAWQTDVDGTGADSFKRSRENAVVSY